MLAEVTQSAVAQKYQRKGVFPETRGTRRCPMLLKIRQDTGKVPTVLSIVVTNE